MVVKRSTRLAAVRRDRWQSDVSIAQPRYAAPMPSLRGERVLLREWTPEDRVPFAALNADPRVMEHMPKVLTRDESDALAARCEAQVVEHGYGLWAVEIPEARFLGYVGLARPRFESAFTPCVEVGWRIAHAHWGRGYVTEAARLVLTHAFDVLGLEEIVSFTVRANVRSWSVMDRLGMIPDGEFDHPALPEGHHLRRHVLYRLTASGFRTAKVRTHGRSVDQPG